MTSRKLGHYDIVDKLGAGGMGEVYRATDTRLGREVAIKILPDAFAQDEERRARFEREARLLASLNHPNIGAIHGLEHADGTHFLVLELVPGEDLTDKIARGPIALDEALDIARQIATALGAAHEQGVVHRDLKPGNIRITPDGTVKVLDFGLAKAVEGDTGDSNISRSPTVLITGSPTAQGVILGTAAYMSPEQARGKAVDKRTDVWAFGCVLFEMLTGTMTFAGETVTDTLAKILEREPQWDKLPTTIPHHVRRVLKRCLTKDPRERLHDIADARIELDTPLADDDAPAVVALARTSGGRSIALITGGITAVIALVIGFFGGRALMRGDNSPPPQQKVRRFVTPVPGSATNIGVVAIAPDGDRMAYSIVADDGRLRLVVRRLDELIGVRNDATLNAFDMSFSPDGKSIAYSAESGLFRVPAEGGEPRRICDTRTYESCHWWKPDEIVISYVNEDNVRGIYRVPAAGGTPEPVIVPRDDKGEFGFGHPFVLPGGRGILFDARINQRRTVMVYDGDSGEIHELVEDNAEQPRYTETGHLLFVNFDTGSIMAARMDLTSLQLTGMPVAVVNAELWEGEYAISRDGTLVYLPQNVEFESNRVDRFMPGGEVTTLLESGGPWANPSLSHDGKRLLVREVKAKCVVWVYDLERKTMSRLTFDGDCHRPLWSPDDRYVIYSLEDASMRRNFMITADGSAPPRPVGDPAVDLMPHSWSRDGTWVTVDERNPQTGFDIYLQNMDEEGPQKPWLQTRFDERSPVISPDGRWIAYTSNETGVNEVYVRPFDLSAGRYVISAGGGQTPRWSPGGKQLYFRNGEVLYRADVTVQGDKFSASRPVKVFDGLGLLDRDYYVEPDGGIVMIGQTGDLSRSGELVVVLGFFQELNSLVP